MPDIHKILKQHWGFDTFRPLQQEIISSIVNGYDTLALLPTGGGKSVCFQVPALAEDGLCLVISPLIALMKDQVENLRRKGITAFAIYSGMSRQEVINTFQVAVNSNCKFLYVSPERLETSLFLEYLPGMNVNLIAVDEAHCISQWGYDFRPPYLRIAALREQLPHVPVLALTASATPEVQKDICAKLTSSLTSPLTPLHKWRGEQPPKVEGSSSPLSPNHKWRGEQSLKTEDSFYNWKIFRQSFERKNLSYSVFQVDSKINKLIEILANVPGSAIVYCKSRKRSHQISDLLQMQKISSDFYHAGLSREDRNRKQEDWINNKTRVIVCTNAFGMGIDKPDVRVVVHADVPDCLENYYQEAGRAGRDSKRAYAVLLYSNKDLKELEDLAEIRFPTIENIRNVYQSVANYLQIPSNSGDGVYYDFDMADFLKKFKLNSNIALYALKALEQSEWLSFNEQFFSSSTLLFTINKTQLYDFEKSHPQLESLIKALLRAYEGIFDYRSFISELQLVRLLKKNVKEIKNELLQLHRFGIIEYHPQKDNPQICLLRSRVKMEDLFINLPDYNKRKDLFRKRIAKITHFIKETAQCRSLMIGSYFGDSSVPPCGICDNCLRLKKFTLSKDEFEKINQRIIHILKTTPSHTKELLQKLNGIKKEKAWKVIEFLQAENKIELDKNGWIRLT